MRTASLLIGGLALLLAACGPTRPGGSAGSASPGGIPSAGTGTISPVQGQSDAGPANRNMTRP